MYRLTLIFIFLLFSLHSNAQGIPNYEIFKTYDDYQNRNVEHENSKVNMRIGYVNEKFTLAFTTTSGEKIKYKQDDINFWGFRTGSVIYRMDNKMHPFKLKDDREICVFVAYDTSTRNMFSFYSINKDFSPKFSRTMNGQMMEFSKGNLMKLFKDEPEWREKIKACENDVELLYRVVDKYNTQAN